MNRNPFGVDEWYHCYSRGVDKRNVFLSAADYQRFLQLLFLANSEKVIHRSTLFDMSHEEILNIARGNQLVNIGAYCLMPNHFHLLLEEVSEGGISRFMQRLGTAYTMYFNKKNDRVGNLFVKPFRSKHVADENYFRYVAQYLHLNPAEIFEPKWKEGIVNDISGLERKLLQYPYSSLPDYHGIFRSERALLHEESFDLIGSGLPPLNSILADASSYYAESR